MSHELKTLHIHRHKVQARHIELAQVHGDDTFNANMPNEFYACCPEVPGFERAEPGCLIATTANVEPHTDSWLGRWGRPRKQRSFFWLLAGEVVFKVDGCKHARLATSDWVVFDHRREHMVLADGDWLGAAWQLRTLAVNRAPSEPAP